MKRLFSFSKRAATPPPRVPSVSEGVGGWMPVKPYPTPHELTQLMPGGMYQFDLMIGQGGMGAVYRGRQLNLGRAVAIKILHRDHGTDYAYAERFRREAQALAQVCELTWQLRGQATGRQVEGARVGVTANQGLFGHGSSVVLQR